MRKLSVSQAWDETRAILARDGRLFVSVALALVVLPQTIIGVFGLPHEGPGAQLSRILVPITVLIGFAAQIALNRLAMSPPTTVGAAIMRGFARLILLILALILIGIVLALVVTLIATLLLLTGAMRMPAAGQAPSAGVLLMFIVPTVLLSAIFQLCVPVAAAEEGGPIHLVRRSWALGRANYWRLLGFVTLIFVAAGVSILVGQLVVGSLVVLAFGQPHPGSVGALVYALVVALIQSIFTVIGAVMLARIYLQLADRDDAPAGVPISGT